MSNVTGGSGSLVQSSTALGLNAVFNLCNEKDVVTLLRRIHQSPLSVEVKNQLRDIVFSYRSTPETPVTDEVKSLFSEHGFSISTDMMNTDSLADIQKPVENSGTKNPLGSTRPRPIFSPISVTLRKKEEKSQVAIPSSHQSELEIHSEASKLQAVPTPKIVPPPQSQSPKHVDVPKEEVVMPQEDIAPSVPSSVNAMERIKEIKKEVNMLVGNPVNLIDVNNEVGREYMNSLLDAMKKNNGGSSAEMSDAMDRLEKAFVSVKQTVTSSNEAIPHKKESAKVLPEQEKNVLSTTPNIDDSKPIPPTKTQDTKVEHETSASGFTSVHQTHVEEQSQASVVDSSTHKMSGELKEIAKSQGQIKKTSVDFVSQPSTPTEVGGMKSVAKEKQIQDLRISQKKEAALTDKQKEAIEIASMDPLMTPEVTSGLQQLLSEWTLFKSSGIFGTGGSGMEHPLYKQLANLTMTAVVAGRFEGASPHIKRSITDYMNGWRYEEGIMQEQGELFEHYLRRVIKHILDKRTTSQSN